MAVDGIDFAWWLVDLGENHLVKEVEVHPAGSGAHFLFFKDIEVRLGLSSVTDGNFSSWTLIDAFLGPPSSLGSVIKFALPESLCGRYVSVKRT
ncbi:hypothetical protein SK128_027081, partial [Halocaridina rubra]